MTMTDRFRLLSARISTICALSIAALHMPACWVGALFGDGEQMSNAGKSPNDRPAAPADAGVDEDEATDASDGSTEGNHPVDVFALLPISNANPAGVCAGCIETNCGAAINRCVNDRTCVEGLACTLTQCSVLGGSNTASAPSDFPCLVGCFNGDIAAAIEVIGSAICLTQTCNASCSSLAEGDNGLPSGSAGAANSASGSALGGSGSAGTGNSFSEGSQGPSPISTSDTDV